MSESAPAKRPNFLVRMLPSRSMLFSGTDNHLAGLGQMGETAAREPLFAGKPGYEGVLNQRVAALSEILADGGYETFMSGKWHLGMTPESVPSARGFQRVFGLLPGAGNHYGFEPFLEDGTPAMKIIPPIYVEDAKRISHLEIPLVNSKPFYSTSYFTDRMIGYLSERDVSKPFFAYLPYTAPHWPIQADPAITAKYRGRYNAGPEALRLTRLAALKAKGLVALDAVAHPMEAVFGTKPWEELSEETRKREARVMEVYAAMIETMDTEIGRVIQHLKDAGEWENTTVFFSSDNGAEGTLLEAIPIMGEALQASISKHYDNSFDNIGAGNSFTWIGPRWAQAATAPSKMYKGWCTEGGVRCPAIVRAPKSTRAAGSVSHAFTTVMDILPTLLEQANIPHPAPLFRGRKVLQPRGKSWVSFLERGKSEVHDENAIHGWELFGQAAIRQGKYKALFIPKPTGNDKWRLFDLSVDPGEITDLATKEPEVLAKLLQYWQEYVAETGTIMTTADTRAANGAGYGWTTGLEGMMS